MTTPAAQAYANALGRYPAPVTRQLGRELSHTDRCDKCGHAAYVRTESHASTLQLMWCAHHFSEVEKHFPTSTHFVLDERPFLKRAVKAQSGQE